MSIPLLYKLRLRDVIETLRKETEAAESSSSPKGATSQTFLLTNTQHGQLQVLYHRFNAISKIKTSLERFGRDHRKQKSQITKDFMAKIDSFYEKAQKDIDEFLASLRVNLLKELGSKKEEDVTLGLSIIDELFAGVSFEEKLEGTKELTQKYVGMKNRVKELITVPNDHPSDDIPLLTKEKQRELDGLLGNVPSFEEDTYGVSPVSDIQLFEEKSSTEKLLGFKETYSFQKDTNLVKVQSFRITNLQATPLLTKNGFGTELKWRVKQTSTKPHKFQVYARRVLGDG